MRPGAVASILVFIVFTRSRSVTAHVATLLGIVSVLVVALSVGVAYLAAVRRVEQVTAARVTDVAWAIAATDDVRQGLASADPAAALADFADRQQRLTGTDFVVVMSTDGIRYTHPTPELVGGRFAGSIAEAQAGGVVLERYVGSLGPSTRAVVPVVEDGRVIGLVSVGLRQSRVESQLNQTAARDPAAGPGRGAAVRRRGVGRRAPGAARDPRPQRARTAATA